MLADKPGNREMKRSYTKPELAKSQVNLQTVTAGAIVTLVDKA
jgi:hypothetical protein